MGISTPWICLPASLSKTRYCASLHPTRNATQWLPKWLLNSLSLHNRMTCELSTRRFYQKGPKRVWKLLPSVSGSSIKNGRLSLSWSTLIVFLRNELDTWAIAFLAKPSSTPNRSDLIDWNRMLTSVNLKKTGMACRNIVIKNNTRCFKSALQ